MEKNQQIIEVLAIDNLQTIAQKAAYCTVKLLYTKAPTEILRKLLNGIATHHNTDSEDIISVATISLLESLKNNDTTDYYIKACKAVRQYIYSQNNSKGRLQQNNSIKIVKINNLIKKATALYLSKKTDANYKRLTQLQALKTQLQANNKTQYSTTICYIDDNSSDVENIINVNADINNIIRKNDISNVFILELLSILSPTEKRILQYITKGYTNTTICKYLHYTNSNTLYQHINNIRKKADKLKDKYNIKSNVINTIMTLA